MTKKTSPTTTCASSPRFVALLVVVSTFCIIEKCNAFMTPTTPMESPNKIMMSQTTTSGGRQPTSLHAVATKSASSVSSFGPTLVDMNQYNLDIDEIAQEWTAVVVPESSLREEGIYLGAKSSKEIMVDTFKVEFPRIPNQGMGIELLELAGGREDGLGITVVNGLVEGGTTASGIKSENDIMVGDSISKIAIKRTKKSSSQGGALSDAEEIEAIDVECFGYDKTVDAIIGLPPASEDETESFVLTIKRLRRKPKVTIQLQYPPSQNEPDTTIELFSGENLRRAMLTRGVKLNDPYSRRFDSGGIGDCGAEGTCATCVVNVMEGMELLNDPKEQESQILKNKPRYRMACRAIVGYGFQSGTMKIQVNPRQF